MERRARCSPCPTRIQARGALAAAWSLAAALFAAACLAGGAAVEEPTPEPIDVAGHPYESINEAVAAARPHAEVRLHGGTYNEQVEITKPVVLVPYGDGPVWIDPECEFENGISIVASDVTVRGIGVRRSNGAAVRLDAADNVTLEDLTIQDWNCADEEEQYRAGVASWEGGSDLVVRNSRFERRVDVDGPDDGYGNGIWVKNSSALDGGGHVFSGNTIIGGFDGIGGEPEDEAWGSFKAGTVIENNVISDCSDDGIQVEGGTQDVVVRGNEIRRCLVGIAFAPALRGPLLIARNVVLEPLPRRGEGPAMLKVGDGSLGEVLVYHNSFFAGETAADGLKQTNAGLANITFRNNAIYAGRYVMETGIDMRDVDMDYDALATSDGERFAVWAGDMLPTFDLLRSAGQEANGVAAVDFVWDADLRPWAGSPLIDSGVPLPGVNDGYAGDAPDIGAVEYGAD